MNGLNLRGGRVASSGGSNNYVLLPVSHLAPTSTLMELSSQQPARSKKEKKNQTKTQKNKKHKNHLAPTSPLMELSSQQLASVSAEGKLFGHLSLQ